VIVPDASAVIELLTRSERGLRVESRLLGDSVSLHAPALLDLEVAQVLRRYAARGDVSAHWARTAIGLMMTFPVTRYVHEPLLARIWELRENVTAYDAAYVALAEALRAPIVTCDARLGKVKGLRAVVEVIN
jgi:predicted nucleic acid-binding protein